MYNYYNVIVDMFILQFFERLEVFAYESVKKQEEFTERIKREVRFLQLINRIDSASWIKLILYASRVHKVQI